MQRDHQNNFTPVKTNSFVCPLHTPLDSFRSALGILILFGVNLLHNQRYYYPATST